MPRSLRLGPNNDIHPSEQWMGGAGIFIPRYGLPKEAEQNECGESARTILPGNPEIAN